MFLEQPLWRKKLRTFNQRLSKNTDQCLVCGLVKGHCLCSYSIHIQSDVEFWLLTHENEMTRTNNTGRLIERAIETTRVFQWSRTQPPQEMIDLISDYNVYLIFSAEREDPKRVKTYQASKKKTAFLILDGTWKEARKMLRKSDYLKTLPILSLTPISKTSYDLRRNHDEGHICTVEVGIELLQMIGETAQSKALNEYFEYYLECYHDGKYEHEGVKK